MTCVCFAKLSSLGVTEPAVVAVATSPMPGSAAPAPAAASVAAVVSSVAVAAGGGGGCVSAGACGLRGPGALPGPEIAEKGG